jgi:hypothetical protein
MKVTANDRGGNLMVCESIFSMEYLEKCAFKFNLPVYRSRGGVLDPIFIKTSPIFDEIMFFVIIKLNPI